MPSGRCARCTTAPSPPAGNRETHHPAPTEKDPRARNRPGLPALLPPGKEVSIQIDKTIKIIQIGITPIGIIGKIITIGIQMASGFLPFQAPCRREGGSGCAVPKTPPAIQAAAGRKLPPGIQGLGQVGKNIPPTVPAPEAPEAAAPIRGTAVHRRGLPLTWENCWAPWGWGASRDRIGTGRRRGSHRAQEGCWISFWARRASTSLKRTA